MAQTAAAEIAAHGPYLADLDKSHLHPLWDRYKRITPMQPRPLDTAAPKSWRPKNSASSSGRHGSLNYVSDSLTARCS